MHDDASTARCDKGSWQKSTQWSELCLDIKQYITCKNRKKNPASKASHLVQNKEFRKRSLQVKRVGVGEPIDIVFDALFRPFVISLLQIR